MRLSDEFYKQSAIEVAKQLIGKRLLRRYDDGTLEHFIITETEAYMGNGDRACHASKGVTARTEAMFDSGGVVYVYLIYGMYWLLNIVTGKEGEGEAVLIRGVKGVSGPGRLGRRLKLDKSFYRECLLNSERIWIENGDDQVEFRSTPRINIDYAGEPWVSKPWRFVLYNFIKY